MNKYAIIYFSTAWTKQFGIQKMLLRYENLQNKKLVDGAHYYNVLEGISVIKTQGPKIIEFVDENHYKIIFKPAASFLYRKKFLLELDNNEDKLFEAEDDESAKLIFEVEG